MRIVGTKRDVDSAFTRCRLHPDGADLFGTEFELGNDVGDTVAFSYLVLPVGFTASPGIFGGNYASGAILPPPILTAIASMERQTWYGSGCFRRRRNVHCRRNR